MGGEEERRSRNEINSHTDAVLEKKKKKRAAHDTLEGARGRPNCEGRDCSSGRQVRRC